MSSRSSWRLPYVHPFFFSQGFEKNKAFVTRRRWLTIPLLPSTGRSFYVYDGRKNQPLVYKKEMVGHKLGAFVLTKKIGHVSKEGKRKKKR